MNGKDYIAETIVLVESLLKSARDAAQLKDAPVLESLTKACEALQNLKSKPTLRTKSGTNMALPVYEAGQNFNDEWEEFQNRDDADTVKEAMEDFVDAVYALEGGLKDRTITFT